MAKKKSLQPDPAAKLEHGIKANFYQESILLPTYTFEIGEMVRYGNHTHAQVVTCSGDKKFYLIEVHYSNRDGDHTRQDVVLWFDLGKLDKLHTTQFTTPRLNYRILNTDISGLISRVNHFGVDFNPTYQRGLVWNQEQKEDLIKTIFEHGSIGTFSFNRRSYSEPILFEIVDGKQRLSTLEEFIQDRFTFRGLLHSELSRADQHTISQHGVLIYDLEEASLKEILTLFLLVNRRGTPVDENHITQVEKQLGELD